MIVPLQIMASSTRITGIYLPSESKRLFHSLLKMMTKGHMGSHMASSQSNIVASLEGICMFCTVRERLCFKKFIFRFYLLQWKKERGRGGGGFLVMFIWIKGEEGKKERRGNLFRWGQTTKPSFALASSHHQLSARN